ncbi:MAG: Gldg family protein [Verrucomicrobium sp.]|nr:GldG family protein [Verrucomicrobium sp.]
MPAPSPAPSPEPSPPSAPPARPLRRWGIGLNVLFQLVLLVVLFGVVNYLSFRHYLRVDLSPSKDYTLSETTTSYIKKLSKDVELTLVFSRDSVIMQDMRALAEEYRQVKKSRVRVEEIDPARDVEDAEKLKLAHGITLTGNGILVRSNDRNRFISESEIVIKGLNGDRDNPSVDLRGEDAITSAIIGLIEGRVRRFYFISGKGAVNPGGTELAYIALADLGKQQNFEVMPLNLAETEVVPEDASGVILVGARYDLSDRELQQLDAYWQTKRASLLVLLDPNGETPRLHSFLAKQGVVPRKDRVLYAESTSTGPKVQFSVQTVFLQDSPISKPFTEIAASFSGQTQSLDLQTLSPELASRQIQVQPLIDASERYWGETEYTQQLPTVGREDTRPPVHIAASVERGAVGDERLRVDSARMVVVANALLLDPGSRLAVHQDFISSSLNWMLNRERLIGVTPKRKQIYRLELTNDQRQQLFWVTALLMPGAVLGLGFLVWTFRRA